MSSADIELKTTIDRVAPALLAIDEAVASRRLQPDSWSAKEIIGHLIDSAANNHRRFVEAQLKDDLVFPGYDQEAWVSKQRYQDQSWRDLVALWHMYNSHLSHVMASIPTAVREKSRIRHNLPEIAWRPVPKDERTTLEYFMGDYVGHLKHHVSQVFAAVGLAETM
jgi:hypothetical protein